MFFETNSDSEDSSSEDVTVTELDPSFGKKEKCNCKDCKTRSCNCFKYGSGCNPSCGCASSCQNMFNNLSYFFGDDFDAKERCDANLCFVEWLVKKCRGTGGFNAIDRDNLRNLIMASGR